MKYCLVLIMFSIAGCATTKNYEKILDGWIGSDADQLAWKWGPPTDIYSLASGDKMLSYSSSTTSNSYTVINPEANMAATYSSNQYCKTFFVSDKKNIITAWHWQGTDCTAIIQKSHGPGPRPVNGWSKDKL